MKEMSENYLGVTFQLESAPVLSYVGGKAQGNYRFRVEAIKRPEDKVKPIETKHPMRRRLQIDFRPNSEEGFIYRVENYLKENKNQIEESDIPLNLLDQLIERIIILIESPFEWKYGSKGWFLTDAAYGTFFIKDFAAVIRLNKNVI